MNCWKLYSHDSSEREGMTTIGKHYRLLRRVETALRLGLDMKTHLLPADDESLDYLARLLKYPSGTELLLSLRSSMKETRTMFESILRSLK